MNQEELWAKRSFLRTTKPYSIQRKNKWGETYWTPRSYSGKPRDKKRAKKNVRDRKKNFLFPPSSFRSTIAVELKPSGEAACYLHLSSSLCEGVLWGLHPASLSKPPICHRFPFMLLPLILFVFFVQFSLFRKRDAVALDQLSCGCETFGACWDSFSFWGCVAGPGLSRDPRVISPQGGNSGPTAGEEEHKSTCNTEKGRKIACISQNLSSMLVWFLRRP